MSTDPVDADVPPIPPFNDRAVRWAVARGIIRAGAVATALIFILVMVLVLATAVLRSVQGNRFSGLAFDSLRAGHPEYTMSQLGSCCTVGPLGGVSNLGLASRLSMLTRPTGALNYPGDGVMTLDQSVSGHVTVDYSQGPTPLGSALQRGRPDRSATVRLLRGLPAPTDVSALVELAQPLDAAGFAAFYAASVPTRDVPDRTATLYFSDPYDDAPVTWPDLGADGFQRWAAKLRSSDDAMMSAVGLPPVAEVQRDADRGLVYAIIVPRMPLSLAEALANDPEVRSLNVLDVGFDPAGA